MEETLEELRQEESLQRSSHSELVTDYQQLTCDNQFWQVQHSASAQTMMKDNEFTNILRVYCR